LSRRRTVWKEDFNQVANQFRHRDSLVAKINNSANLFFRCSTDVQSVEKWRLKSLMMRVCV
jgi:hypothetical protein